MWFCSCYFRAVVQQHETHYHMKCSCVVVTLFYNHVTIYIKVCNVNVTWLYCTLYHHRPHYYYHHKSTIPFMIMIIIMIVCVPLLSPLPSLYYYHLACRHCTSIEHCYLKQVTQKVIQNFLFPVNHFFNFMSFLVHASTTTHHSLYSP